MSNVRCKRNFKRIKLDALDEFGLGVRDGIYGNPLQFPNPTFPQVQFEQFVNNYSNTRAAYVNGGIAQKGPFLIAREELIGALETMADYVDGEARGSEAIILMSGFVPTKGNSSSAPKPEQPTGVILRHVSTGVLRIECDNQVAVDTYLCILTANAPIPMGINVTENGQIIGMGSSKPETAQAMTALSFIGPDFVFDFNKSRKKIFSGLVPGTVYYAAFIAINAQGVSKLSVPASIMCV
jgi:hypothetical protein